MIKELLKKREDSWSDITKEIMSLYSENLIKGLRFYIKTDRNITIESINTYYKNENFLVIKFLMELKVGDTILAADGKFYKITEDNKELFYNEVTSTLLPVFLIENGSAIEIYEQLKSYDEFTRKYGSEKFLECIDSGINSFNDLLIEKYKDLLEKITDPSEEIVKNLDDLQKIQFRLYSNNSSLN